MSVTEEFVKVGIVVNTLSQQLGIDLPKGTAGKIVEIVEANADPVMAIQEAQDFLMKNDVLPSLAIPLVLSALTAKDPNTVYVYAKQIVKIIRKTTDEKPLVELSEKMLEVTIDE